MKPRTLLYAQNFSERSKLEYWRLSRLTYFLKVVYAVQAMGNQPLDYLELVCVPNGLLLFDGPKYALTPGLLIPGKDEKDHPKKRTRVRLLH